MKNAIKLSTGEYYKPKKGEYPACPCDECKYRDIAKWRACNAGFGVCAAYMDYEHMKAVYRLTVFE